jgi:uncharacterized protein (TIRG00374 family)
MSQTQKPLRSKAIAVLLILGLAAFIAYFYFFINPSQVIAILSKTNLALYAFAFIAYSLYVLFSSLVWHRLLLNLSVKITERKALLYTWVGLFFEATVPQLGWSAEISKTYLLSKDAKVDAGKISASVVGQKIFVMTQTIVALAVGLTSVLVSYKSLPPLVIFLIALVLALSILALAIVYYVSIKPSATKTLLNFAVRVVMFFRKSWNPQNFRLKAEEMLGGFHTGFSQLKANPKGLIQPIIFSVVGFIFEVSVVFFTFIALGYTVPINVVLIVFTLTGTLQTVGVTFFGFPEVIMSASFTALLGPSAAPLSFSVTLLTRIVNLWFRLIVSYIAFQWAGVAILRKNKLNPPA